jgi:hypothetical protein
VIHDYYEWNGERKDTAPEIVISTVGKMFDWKTQHWYFGEYTNDSLGNWERINCHPEFEIFVVSVFRPDHSQQNA